MEKPFRTGFTMDAAVNKRASEVLKNCNMTLSEYVRQAVAYVAEGNVPPFPNRPTGVRPGPRSKQ